MNNYILISKTYQDVTPESAEYGDFSGQGFLTECEQVTFRELVDLMKEHNESSCSPDNGSTHNWYSCYPYTYDFRKGITRTEAIHFHTENTPNAAKYWKWARIAANKIN